MSEDVKSEGHTPTPWYINTQNGPTQFAAVDPFDDVGVCFVESHADMERGKANARLIVTAVNEHEALLRCEAALRALLGGDDKMQVAIGGNPNYVNRFLDNARAALTLLDEARHGK